MTSLITLALYACGTAAPPAPPSAPPPEEAVAQKVAPVEAAIEVPAKYTAIFKAVDKVPVKPMDKDQIELGRMLYYDTRLSASQTISCNSCHLLDAWGVDNQPTSPGHTGERGVRNSPSTYYAYGHFAQFWDGRAADVEAQALGPILNPVEMGMPDDAKVLETLESIPGYQTAFAKAFPDQNKPMTYENVGKAIGAFERHLVTPSPFDAYLGGKGDALTAEQRDGLALFVDTGCISCHNGAFLGGNAFQKLGLVEPWPTTDEGRKEVTGNEADLHMFKVPSLRNVAKTAPYLHDGSVATLPEMVSLMAKHQLGKTLEDAQVASIVTFLESLTGTIDKAYIAQPALPPNGPETPGPLN